MPTPWMIIGASEVDAKSPVSDNLNSKIKTNFDYLKSVLSDGAAAAQAIDALVITLRAAGVALQVDHDANVDGTLTVGSLVASNFVIPDSALHYLSL